VCGEAAARTAVAKAAVLRLEVPPEVTARVLVVKTTVEAARAVAVKTAKAELR
jgi:hypothetical protein